jgi:hypothetical protein
VVERRVRRLLRCRVPERSNASSVARLTALTRFAGVAPFDASLNPGMSGSVWSGAGWLVTREAILSTPRTFGSVVRCSGEARMERPCPAHVSPLPAHWRGTHEVGRGWG